MAGNPSIDNLHPIFLQQLMAFVAASGGRVQLGSGWRSVAKQAELYADWLAGKPGQARAAPPGKSNHNFGLAMDLVYLPGGKEWAHQNAARFGLFFPMDDEDWHIEPLAINQMKGDGGAVADLGFQTMSPAEARDQAKALYGYLGWFVDHPEIGPLLIKGATEGWDAARLQGALAKTKWWRTTSESARQFDALLISDPATASRRIKETALSFRLQAAQLGVPLDNNRVFTMSANAQRLGWNEDEMRLALVAEMKYRPNQIPTGGTAKMMTEVSKVAADHMVPINSKQAFQWAKRIIGGAADMDAVNTQFQRLAAVRFPHLATQIANGMTPAQFFDPYRNVIARTLGVSPDDIDLMAKEWGPVTSFADRKTGQTRPMTFTEAERYARARPEWAETDDAWESVGEAGNALLTLFGVTA